MDGYANTWERVDPSKTFISHEWLRELGGTAEAYAEEGGKRFLLGCGGKQGRRKEVPGVIQCCLHVVSCEKLQVRESSLKLKEDLIVLQTLNISAWSLWWEL